MKGAARRIILSLDIEWSVLAMYAALVVVLAVVGYQKISVAGAIKSGIAVAVYGCVMGGARFVGRRSSARTLALSPAERVGLRVSAVLYDPPDEPLYSVAHQGMLMVTVSRVVFTASSYITSIPLDSISAVEYIPRSLFKAGFIRLRYSQKRGHRTDRMIVLAARYPSLLSEAIEEYISILTNTAAKSDTSNVDTAPFVRH